MIHTIYVYVRERVLYVHNVCMYNMRAVKIIHESVRVTNLRLGRHIILCQHTITQL